MIYNFKQFFVLRLDRLERLDFDDSLCVYICLTVNRTLCKLDTIASQAQ